MVAQRTQSGLLAKLGKELDTAFETHKGDETTYSGFSDLPGGIKNGIAQLVKCQFQEVKEGDNAGKTLFYIEGRVVRPIFFIDSNGEQIKVEGGITRITEPVYATPNNSGPKARKTVAHHVAHILNEMRRLGAKTDDPKYKGQPASVVLEKLAAELVQKAPFFKFRTWQGSGATTGQDRSGQWFVFQNGKQVPGKGPYKTEDDLKRALPWVGKEPKVTHFWDGKCDPPPKVGNNSAEMDAGGLPEASENGVDHTDVPESPDETPTPEFNEFTDLNSLVEAAESGDLESQGKLEEMALGNGLTAEDVAAADDWAHLAQLITDKGTGDQPDDASKWVPEVGGVYLYKPLGPGNKPSKTAVEVEVESLDEEKRTCLLANFNKKTVKYKNISFDALEGKEG